jgi:ComF family protein
MKRSASEHYRQRLLDLLFPPRCAGCGASGHLLCPACLAQIRRLQQPRCPSCALPFDGQICRSCCQPPHPQRALHALQAVAAYREPLRTCIHQFKYRGAIRLAEPLGLLLAETYRTCNLRSEILVAVPLHTDRERQRGYNHAALLARVCARTLGLPLCERSLERQRPTTAQAGLQPAERRQNVAGAFRCRPDPTDVSLRGRTVLLIDDVCTTGATLEACALALLAGGAATVGALVLAQPI